VEQRCCTELNAVGISGQQWRSHEECWLGLFFIVALCRSKKNNAANTLSLPRPAGEPSKEAAGF